MTVASRIGVMDAGRLEQVATPRELYEAPVSRWIAEFVGDVNLFEGQIESREAGRLAGLTPGAGKNIGPGPRPANTKNLVRRAVPPQKGKLFRRAPGLDEGK